MFLLKSCLWEKSFSLVIDQNALSQSDCNVLNHLFLQNRAMKQPHFLHVDTNSQSSSKIFWLGMVKSRYGQSGLWTLNLSVWTKLMELTVVLHAGNQKVIGTF